MKQVIAPIFKQNYEGTYECVSSGKPIDCDNSSIEGIEWFTPRVESGVMKGYDRSRGSTKPTEDSVKTIRVRVGGQTYWIAIADNENESAFADACNQCCADGTPTMNAPTIPEPIVEDCQCADADGNTTFRWAVPPLIAGQTITAKTTANGEYQTTSTAQTSAANLRTWLAANLGALGTWSVETDANGTFIKLVSDSTEAVLCASMVIELVSNDYCLDTESITFPAVITGYRHNAATVVLPTSVTVNSLAELIAAVGNYFADGTLTETLDQVQYAGTGVPSFISITGDGNVAFTLGACEALGGTFLASKKKVVTKPAKKAAPKKKAAKKKAAKKK